MRETVEDIGETVICDFCGKDYTNRTDSGGLLLQSKAACPVCAPGIKASAIKYHEEHYIRGYCPEGTSFRDWVLSLRNGDNTIREITFESREEMLAYFERKKQS